MKHILFLIFLLTGLLVYVLKKQPTNKLAITTVGVYLTSSLFGIIWFQLHPQRYDHLNYWGYIYFFLVFLISIKPILDYRGYQDHNLGFLDKNFLKIFSIILIILYIPSEIFLIPHLFDNLSLMLVDESLAKEIYQQTAFASSNRTSIINNLLSIIQGFFSQIVLFLFFYYLTLKEKKLIIIVGLGISAMFPLLKSFQIASRTNMLWWIVDVIVCIIIFFPFYSKKVKRIVSVPTISVIGLMGVMFALITLSRFGDREDTTLEDSIIRYAGESTVNFNQYQTQNDVCQYGDNNFPVFRRFLGLDSSSNLYDRHRRWRHRMPKIKQGIFYTYIGDFCMDFGFAGSIILLSLLTYFVYKIVIHGGKKVQLYQIFMLFIWSSMIINSVFYFRYKTIGGNIQVFAAILFVWILKEFKNKKI